VSGYTVAPNSAATTTTSSDNTGKNVSIYVFTDTSHGNDYNSRVLSISVGVASLSDSKNTYTVIPVGLGDKPPEPGPNTYVVTHGYANLTSPLGLVFGGLGIGIQYDGTVLVPMTLNTSNTMSGAALESRYGSSNVFYCGQNGQTAYPWSIASNIVNANMSAADRQRIQNQNADVSAPFW
jgi:hypothetical protein